MQTTATTPLTAPEEPPRGPAMLQPLRLRDFQLAFGAVSLMFTVAGGIVVAAALAGLFAGVPSQMTDEAAA